MHDSVFEAIIDEALSELPREFSKRIDNVSIVLQDWPDGDQLSVLRKRGDHGTLLGLYQGTPQTRRGSYGIGGHLPDKITIFKNPLLMISRSRENLIENIKDTVIHEIAHHFGMSDEEIMNAKARAKLNS